MRAAFAKDFASFREAARGLLSEQVPPENVTWSDPRTPSLLPQESAGIATSRVRIPRALAELLEAAACHADPARWALMYRVFWRATNGGERGLLDDAADADVARLTALGKAVDREVHKMHAFVRFRETSCGGEPLFEGWFEPEHDILRRAAPFFRDRFASMRWVIATPRGAAAWDGATLGFIEGPLARPADTVDDKEGLWRTYYASVFNAARVNPRLMRQHMPVRYWKNLPEAAEIARLTQAAMPFADAAESPRWAERVQVDVADLSGPDACRRCELWQHATQGVAGTGPTPARMMIVGEQPGDEEDLKGRPFVGPAGKVLDRALAAAQLSRESIYLTNAVKHFKWEPRGKRRLHKTPAQREVEACHLWLERELEEVRPGVVVALGATAAFALTGRKDAIARLRNEEIRNPAGARIVVTYHPAAVLRGEERADALFDSLVKDLCRAAAAANEKGP